MDNINGLGRAQNANEVRKTWQRGPVNIRRPSGQEISKFTAVWNTEKRGERFIQTQMFCGKEAFSVWRDRHDGRGQIKQALG